MEIVGESSNNTQFNTDIITEWIPYWNGLLHLIGDVNPDTHMIERTYDWDRVQRDCRTYAQNYLNDPTYCDRCAFSMIPSFLAARMQAARRSGFHFWQDCKQMAEDNDILYAYCRSRQKRWRLVLLFVLSAVGLVVVIWFVFYLRIWPSPHNNSHRSWQNKTSRKGP